MNTFSKPNPIVASLVVFFTLFIAGCDSGLNGTYTSDGKSGLISSMTFKPGGKVEITAMGTTQEVSYEVEGKKVKIMTEGKSATILTIDDKGCLDGGGMLGKFCKK